MVWIIEGVQESMKRIASFVMLLVLLASALAACGAATPATSTAPSTAAGGTQASVAASVAAATTAASAAASPSAAATTETMATATTDTTATTTAGTDGTAVAGTDGTAVAEENLPDVSALNLSGIRIGYQGPLSGPQAQFGTTGLNGAQLAVEQLGEQMGFQGVEIAQFDDQATETVGASNANTIAADQNIMCVVGHINSGVALAALPTYRDANLVMISPANTNPRVTEEFDGTAYRLVGRDDVQGVVAADFAVNELQAKNAYVLHDQTAYGEGLATVFRDTLEERGVTVAGFAGTQEQSVFDAVLTPIQAANPDVIFFGGIYSTVGPFIQQLRERGIEATVLGGDGLDSPDLTRLAGETAVGTNYVSVSGPASAYPQAAQFSEDYQSQFNAPAGYPAFQAYDAAKACLLAIANAATEANGKPTREQVEAAMEDVDTFQGVTGTVTFDEEGDRSPATYYVFEVVSGDPENWGQNTVAGTVEAEPPAE